MMTTDSDRQSRLLALMWRLGAMTGRTFRSFDGRSVTVNRPGECLPEMLSASGAEIVSDGVVLRGQVMFGRSDIGPDDYILQVVCDQAPPSMNLCGEPMLQISVDIPPALARAYEKLLDGAAASRCAGTVAGMDGLHRTGLYTALAVERLRRKAAQAAEIFAGSGMDWGQTLYVMMLRSLGDNRNREPYAEIARRVPFTTLMREKQSVQTAEALLLGISGLLDEYDSDEYIAALKCSFEYLCHKYSLQPLKPAAWNLSRINPQNHPVVRLAEFAALVSRQEFVFQDILDCRTPQQVQRIFRCEASPYWQTHFLPGRPSGYANKKIGADKANLMGINLIAPFLFAYGDARDSEQIRMQAIELLESLPAENNAVTRMWRSGGAVMTSAFDTQAVLQLHGEFCTPQRCEACPIGRRQIKKSLEDLALS